MLLRMARPWKHPDSGLYYVRERIPRDVLAKARGRRLVLPQAAGAGSILISKAAEHVKVSMRTRDAHEAKTRHSAALAYLGATWQALRQGPRPLTRKQIVALAGEVYRGFADGGEDDPGSALTWIKVQEDNADAADGAIGPFALLGIFSTAAERRGAAMNARYGKMADALLASKGLVTDAASRAALIEELGIALTQAAEKLQRNAEGDYSSDRVAARFPKFSSGAAGPAVGVTALFDGWKAEAKATGLSPKTAKEYGSLIRRFVVFLGAR